MRTDALRLDRHTANVRFFNSFATDSLLADVQCPSSLLFSLPLSSLSLYLRISLYLPLRALPSLTRPFCLPFLDSPTLTAQTK